MRNLKKILALVLALVMSLSLMATAGAASFQDVTDDNPYKTAIDVLDGLKVFQGFEDGSFKPTSTLNRAQAAVLVYRIATGDVEGKFVANYTDMAQSKFVDLDGYNWARGYINYCQNAKIVVGTSDTTFNPGGNVTGYQLMVMLLRTLGYGKNNEFADPKGWELETAKIAEREGILKNVTGGDFGAAAPRQMVAEILFRGLLHETVQYSIVTPDGYTPSGETLGKRVGLSEVEGVVLGNEHANLQGEDVLPEGKTQLDNNLIDYSTSFDDIGERKLAYLKDGKTVLSIEDSSKNTREFTLDETKLSDLLKKAGISAGDAEHFINFDEVGQYTTPYRIRYVLKYDAAGIIAGSDNTDAEVVWDQINAAKGSKTTLSAKTDIVDGAAGAISVTIKPDGVVSSVDLKWMEYIFADGDLTTKTGDEESTNYDVGEIYVNTQSTKDISDDPDYYYEKFVDTFMTFDENVNNISANEKGNWLKVIDNDGDSKADYVLKVIYTGAQVERVKDDKITLDVKNHTLVSGSAGSEHDRIGTADDVNTLTKQDVVCMSDGALEEGDVVYYAVIDGVARAYKAEMVTATIDKINRNTKSTTTEEGTEYFESGVCNHILDTEYKDKVTDLVGNVKFDLYFDRGGWLMAFIKSGAGDFKLITDGWFNSTKTADEYAARVYNDEEDKQEIVDLASGGNLFISRDVVNYNGIQVDNNDWGALKYLGGTNEGNKTALNNRFSHRDAAMGKQEPIPGAALNGNFVICETDDEGTTTHKNNNVIKTTVASIDEEGNILPVEDYRITGRYDHAMIDVAGNKIPTSAYTAGTAYTTKGTNTAYDSANGGVELRALSTTKYYVVWPTGTESVGVKAFTGYSSVGDITKLVSTRDTKDLALVEDVYAVGTETSRDNQHGNTVYYTADIVVIELNDEPTNARTMVLLVDDEGQVDKTGLRHVQIIDEKGSNKWIDVNNYTGATLLSNSRYINKLEPGLYWCSENGSKDDTVLYKLQPMDADDIRDAECFITGQVQYYAGTVRNDFVVVNPYTVDDDDELYYGIGDGTVEPIIDLEKSKFYELGYGYANTDKAYRENAASLSDEDALTYRDVVEGRVEGVDGTRANRTDRNDDYYDTDDGQSYFYNDVLIRVDSNNKIVYAVSFQNTYNAAGDYDFAQRVWANVIPRAPKATSASIIDDAKALFTTDACDTLKTDAAANKEQLTANKTALEGIKNKTDLTVAQKALVDKMLSKIDAALVDIEIKEYRTEAKTWLKNYADILKAGIDATGTDKALIEAAIDAELEKAIKENGTIDNAGTTGTVAARKGDIDEKKATAAEAMDTAAGAAVGNTLVANFDGATVANTSSVEEGTGFSATIPAETKPAGQKLTFTFDTKKELKVSASSTDPRVDSIAIEGGESVRAVASSFKTVTITVTLTREAAVDAMNGLATDLVVTLTVSDPVVAPGPTESTTTATNPIDTNSVTPVDPVNAEKITIEADAGATPEGTEKAYNLSASRGTTLSQNEDGDNIVETYMTLADGFEVKSDLEKGITAEKVNAGQNLMTAQELESVLWKITINVTVYNAYAANENNDAEPVEVNGNVLAAELKVPVVVDTVKETGTAADYEEKIKAALDEEGEQFPVSMLVVFSDQIEYEIDAVNHKVVVTGTVDKKYGATELNKDVGGKLSEATDVSDEYKAVCHWWYQVEDLDKADRGWSLNPWTHMRLNQDGCLGEFTNVAFIAVPCGEAADGNGINLLLVAVHDRAGADFSEVTYTFNGVEWTVDANDVADSLSA